MVEFFVPGVPQPGGSKKGFYNPKLKRVIITDANAKCKDWRASVVQAASEVVNGNGLLDGPLAVRFDFVFPRPKGHLAKGGALRKAAPQFPTVRPDALKCARSTEDALTGVLWRDDSQIVTEFITKRYGDQAGALIRVRPEVA